MVSSASTDLCFTSQAQNLIDALKTNQTADVDFLFTADYPAAYDSY